MNIRSRWLYAGACCGLLGLLTGGPLAQAQAPLIETWVSGDLGDDANPCDRTAPCFTFAGALARTAPGGEINVFNPGDYGPATITTAITINGNGTFAGVQVSAGNGLVVAAGGGDAVVLRHLSLNGSGTGAHGIQFVSGKSLLVENTGIFGFSGQGIDFQPSGDGELSVTNADIRNNGGSGILASSGGGHALITVVGSRIENNAIGINARGNARVAIRNSTVSNNSTAGVAAQPDAGSGDVDLKNSLFALNGTGVLASGQTTVRLSGVTIERNAVGISQTGGAVVDTSFNNRIAGNGANGAPNPLTATPTSTATSTTTPTVTATPLPTSTDTPGPSANNGGGGRSNPPARVAPQPEAPLSGGFGGPPLPPPALLSGPPPAPPAALVSAAALVVNDTTGPGLTSAGADGTIAIHVVDAPGHTAQIELHFDPTVLAALPSSMQLQVLAAPLTADASSVEQGALGGGTVDPLGPPISIRLIAIDRASGETVALPDAVAASMIELRLPVPAAELGPGEVATWLMEVDSPDGQFFGYVRPPAVFDPTTNTLVLTVPASQLRAVLFLPVVLRRAFVSNFDGATHIWSSAFPDAIDLGIAAPQLTRMQVLAPQLGGRILVLNAFTDEPGWIDAAGVGPVPLEAETVPAVVPAAAD